MAPTSSSRRESIICWGCQCMIVIVIACFINIDQHCVAKAEISSGRIKGDDEPHIVSWRVLEGITEPFEEGNAQRNEIPAWKIMKNSADAKAAANSRQWQQALHEYGQLLRHPYMFGEMPMQERYDVFLSMSKLLKIMGFHQRAELLLYEAMSYTTVPYEAHYQLGLLFLDKEDLEKSKMHLKNCLYFSSDAGDMGGNFGHGGAPTLDSRRGGFATNKAVGSNQSVNDQVLILAHLTVILITEGRMHEAKFFLARILAALETRVAKIVSILSPIGAAAPDGTSQQVDYKLLTTWVEDLIVRVFYGEFRVAPSASVELLRLFGALYQWIGSGDLSGRFIFDLGQSLYEGGRPQVGRMMMQRGYDTSDPQQEGEVSMQIVQMRLHMDFPMVPSNLLEMILCYFNMTTFLASTSGSYTAVDIENSMDMYWPIPLIGWSALPVCAAITKELLWRFSQQPPQETMQQSSDPLSPSQNKTVEIERDLAVLAGTNWQIDSYDSILAQFYRPLDLNPAGLVSGNNNNDNDEDPLVGGFDAEDVYTDDGEEGHEDLKTQIGEKSSLLPPVDLSRSVIESTLPPTHQKSADEAVSAEEGKKKDPSTSLFSSVFSAFSGLSIADPPLTATVNIQSKKASQVSSTASQAERENEPSASTEQIATNTLSPFAFNASTSNPKGGSASSSLGGRQHAVIEVGILGGHFNNHPVGHMVFRRILGVIEYMRAPPASEYIYTPPRRNITDIERRRASVRTENGQEGQPLRAAAGPRIQFTLLASALAPDALTTRLAAAVGRVVNLPMGNLPAQPSSPEDALIAGEPILVGPDDNQTRRPRHIPSAVAAFVRSLHLDVILFPDWQPFPDVQTLVFYSYRMAPVQACFYVRGSGACIGGGEQNTIDYYLMPSELQHSYLAAVPAADILATQQSQVLGVKKQSATDAPLRPLWREAYLDNQVVLLDWPILSSHLARDTADSAILEQQQQRQQQRASSSSGLSTSTTSAAFDADSTASSGEKRGVGGIDNSMAEKFEYIHDINSPAGDPFNRAAQQLDSQRATGGEGARLSDSSTDFLPLEIEGKIFFEGQPVAVMPVPPQYMHPLMDDVLFKIMRSVPALHVVIALPEWFLTHTQDAKHKISWARKLVRRLWARGGSLFHRIRLLPSPLSESRLLQLLRHADLVLDSFPLGASFHTHALAIAAGTPIITMRPGTVLQTPREEGKEIRTYLMNVFQKYQQELQHRKLQQQHGRSTNSREDSGLDEYSPDGAAGAAGAREGGSTSDESMQHLRSIISNPLSQWILRGAMGGGRREGNTVGSSDSTIPWLPAVSSVAGYYERIGMAKYFVARNTSDYFELATALALDREYSYSLRVRLLDAVDAAGSTDEVDSRASSAVGGPGRRNGEETVGARNASIEGGLEQNLSGDTATSSAVGDGGEDCGSCISDLVRFLARVGSPFAEARAERKARLKKYNARKGARNRNRARARNARKGATAGS